VKTLLITLSLFITTISFAQQPIILGQTRELRSTVLDETRSLNIYLPDGYKATDTTRYPVIYLLDGGLDEDFIHVAGLVQFNTFSWVNRIPKSIVVGICNTDRKRDFTFPTSSPLDKKSFPTTGGAGKFLAFIQKELQPYIKENFKVNDQKTLIGESLGGLMAVQILFNNPTLFDKYLIISPSLWWDNGSLLNFPMATWAARVKSKTDVYLAVGKEGLTPGERPRVMEVDVNLIYDKMKKVEGGNISIYFDYLPEETHATIGHQAVLNGFRKLHQKTPNP
jgi:predicted alpha/beta superfamily hydrolase